MKSNEEIMELIKRRRLQLVVHSCIYYRMTENIWSDLEFDTKALELKDLQNSYPELSAKVLEYYKEFIGWTGDTGFHLPINSNRVISIANDLIEYRRVKNDK